METSSPYFKDPSSFAQRDDRIPTDIPPLSRHLLSCFSLERAGVSREPTVDLAQSSASQRDHVLLPRPNFYIHFVLGRLAPIDCPPRACYLTGHATDQWREDAHDVANVSAPGDAGRGARVA